MLKFPDKLDKLIYCSRTIPEIEKCVEELRNLFKYYEQINGASCFYCSVFSVTSVDNVAHQKMTAI
uniref:Uncharacterized protein n=1 Tax=Parascaris equorum TaxID=6256 RepID=A0A914REY9_PAREQ